VDRDDSRREIALFAQGKNTVNKGGILAFARLRAYTEVMFLLSFLLALPASAAPIVTTKL
jgi:hypothetical protein